MAPRRKDHEKPMDPLKLQAMKIKKAANKEKRKNEKAKLTAKFEDEKDMLRRINFAIMARFVLEYRHIENAPMFPVEYATLDRIARKYEDAVPNELLGKAYIDYEDRPAIIKSQFTASEHLSLDANTTIWILGFRQHQAFWLHYEDVRFHYLRYIAKEMVGEDLDDFEEAHRKAIVEANFQRNVCTGYDCRRTFISKWLEEQEKPEGRDLTSLTKRQLMWWHITITLWVERYGFDLESVLNSEGGEGWEDIDMKEIGQLVEGMDIEVAIPNHARAVKKRQHRARDHMLNDAAAQLADIIKEDSADIDAEPEVTAGPSSAESSDIAPSEHAIGPSLEKPSDDKSSHAFAVAIPQQSSAAPSSDITVDLADKIKHINLYSTEINEKAPVVESWPAFNRTAGSITEAVEYTYNNLSVDVSAIAKKMTKLRLQDVEYKDAIDDIQRGIKAPALTDEEIKAEEEKREPVGTEEEEEENEE